MAELKTFALTTEEGKRSVKNCNALRAQMYARIREVLADAGFDSLEAANGDIAIPTCIDEVTGETYYTRLAVSFSAKPLDSKVARKAPAAEPVELPQLFD